MIKIEPIKIESIKKINEVKKITVDSPESILQELKLAVVIAKDKSKPSKQEEAKEILKELKAHTSQRVIKAKIPTHQKILKEQKRKRKIQQPKIKKRVKKVITKKEATHPKNLKKKKQKTKLTKIKKIIKKKKKEIVPKIKTKIVKVTPKRESPTKRTVPLIKQENQTFQNLPEVKILGRVSETEAYEVPNIIPKKIELAQDAVVELPTGSIETQALKNLKEVTPLEVIEMTPAFESIDAEKYNLIKR